MPTTIQVKEDTLNRLKFFKEHSKESYDEIINKILDEIEESHLSDEAIKGIRTGLRELREGKGEPIEKVAKELGIRL